MHMLNCSRRTVTYAQNTSAIKNSAHIQDTELCSMISSSAKTILMKKITQPNDYHYKKN
jgi:hypothetical protein